MACTCIDPNDSNHTLSIELFQVVINPFEPHFLCKRCYESYPIILNQPYTIHYRNEHRIYDYADDGYSSGEGDSMGPHSSIGIEIAKYTLTMIDSIKPNYARYSIDVDYCYQTYCTEDDHDDIGINSSHILSVTLDCDNEISSYWDPRPTAIHWKSLYSNGESCNDLTPDDSYAMHIGTLHPNFILIEW